MTHTARSPAMAPDFTGKSVLVTGGGVGIGRGIAGAFYAAGADVVIAEIDPGRAAGIGVNAIRPGMTLSARTGSRFDNPEMLTPLVEAIFGVEAIAVARADKNPDQTRRKTMR